MSHFISNFESLSIYHHHYQHFVPAQTYSQLQLSPQFILKHMRKNFLRQCFFYFIFINDEKLLKQKQESSTSGAKCYEEVLTVYAVASELSLLLLL